MIEIVGDYWEEAYNHYDALVCTTNTVVKANGELVMGAGIAKAFNSRYPWIAKEWGDRVKQGQNWLLVTGMYTKHAHEKYIIALPTKTDWRLPSTIGQVLNSCRALRLVADYLNLRKILMTRPGCGNGGLEWEYVKEKISPYLDDRFIVINNN